MKNKDRVTLIIFITLIILIFAVFLMNLYKNRKLENVDRKVDYIFETFTYDTIYKAGTELFFQTIELLNKDIFEYEKNANGSIKFFSINNYNSYRKINNFTIVSNTLTNSEIEKFMTLKKIINYENNYYREIYTEEINSTYIGSSIELDYYDENYAYFKSVNYYCNDYNYIGNIEEEPDCLYSTRESTFKIERENNNLRISSLEEITSILE